DVQKHQCRLGCTYNPEKHISHIMSAQISLVTSQDQRKWVAILAVGLSLFLSALDATTVALALPPIASRFQLSDSIAAAITLSYAIPLTLLVLPSGALVSR